jgi:hypothetical protein
MPYLLLSKPKDRPTDSEEHGRESVVLGPWTKIAYETGTIVGTLRQHHSLSRNLTTTEKVYLAKSLTAADLRKVLSAEKPPNASIPIRNSHVYYDGKYYASMELTTARSLLNRIEQEFIFPAPVFKLYDPELITMPTTVGVGEHGKSYGRAMNLGGNGA